MENHKKGDKKEEEKPKQPQEDGNLFHGAGFEEIHKGSERHKKK